MKLPIAILTAISLAHGLHAAEQKPLMRDFMGINAHTVQFDAPLYAPLCRLVRDYHPLEWDIDKTTDKLRPFPIAQHIDWEDKSGKFRSWHAPVDWKEIYSSWIQSGFEIDACIQFGLKLKDWANPEKDAYNYGKAFARYFGPSGEHKLVTSVEIGNEPAGNDNYTPQEYKKIFTAMARGIREGDPKLKILTATAAADGGKKDKWSMPLDIFKGSERLYDVINIHKYAILRGWPAFERTYPENSTLNYRGILQASIDWRDRHARDKEVWITEFGFDASTKEPAPNNKDWVDSTDLQQAQWIVRSFLMFSEMDLDRAYLYWFNDGDTPSFHASSGVTRNHEPKQSYWAMKHLYQSLGDYRFHKAIEAKPEGAFVYEYVHGADPKKSVLVAWSATGEDKELAKKLKLNGKLVRAERMPTTEATVTETFTPSPAGEVEVTLSESPLYLWIER
jgi:hypothetical protein